MISTAMEEFKLEVFIKINDKIIFVKHYWQKKTVSSKFNNLDCGLISIGNE